MAKKPNLVDNLRVYKTASPQHKTTLQDVIHARKPLDVNKELLEDNPDIETVLQNTTNVLNKGEGERSSTRFVVPPYEKQLKDKRFKATQVHNKHLDT